MKFFKKRGYSKKAKICELAKHLYEIFYHISKVRSIEDSLNRSNAILNIYLAY